MPDWLQFFQLARFGRPLLLFVVFYAGLWIVARVFRLRLNADGNFASAARILVYLISAAAFADPDSAACSEGPWSVLPGAGSLSPASAPLAEAE